MPTKMVLSLVDTPLYLQTPRPENEKWRKMLQTPVYQKSLFGFVADEAHVIPYESRGGTSDFRLQTSDVFHYLSRFTNVTRSVR